MNLLVLSDTHGRPDRIRDALKRQPTPPDALIFLGDGLSDLARCDTGNIPVYAVRGNCDALTIFDDPPTPEERLIDLYGIKIFLTHGHRFLVKQGLSAAAAYAARLGADLLLYGHTHIALEENIPTGTLVGGFVTEKPLILFNPGSAAGYRGSFGSIAVRGHNIVCSIGEF